MVTQSTDQLITDLYRARKERQQRVDALEAARREYERTLEQDVDRYLDVTRVVEALEARVRSIALDMYAQTGNKHPFLGADVRVSQRVQYAESRAYDWALEHKLALQLNKKAFEAIAKSQGLGFVMIVEEPSATIAADLAKVVGE